MPKKSISPNYEYLVTTMGSRFVAAFDDLKELKRFLKSDDRDLVSFILTGSGDYRSFDPFDDTLR